MTFPSISKPELLKVSIVEPIRFQGSRMSSVAKATIVWLATRGIIALMEAREMTSSMAVLVTIRSRVVPVLTPRSSLATNRITRLRLRLMA